MLFEKTTTMKFTDDADLEASVDAMEQTGWAVKQIVYYEGITTKTAADSWTEQNFLVVFTRMDGEV